MRLTKSFTVPTELEQARADGELVVFAGAGVSIASPANLPGFVALACEIAGPVVPWEERFVEGIDRYLGQAERKGVLVQERAREKLLARGGRHTALHEHFLGLFAKPARVRLITTNFDPFFSNAADAVFPGSAIRKYVGPALPPGRDFAGIAQIHGSLAQTEDRLVLTDHDFAAAYMADGWATRFLLGVFAQRAVVFTGYRLGDPVIQYLIRALPRNSRWYALCHQSERERWSDFGVEPVVFDTTPSGDKYAELHLGMQRWRWYAQASPVDHDAEMRWLVATGPPASPQEADYVRTRLATDAGRTTFLRAALTEEWFNWVASVGLLDPLTDELSTAVDLRHWGDWCLTNFADGDAPPLLKWLGRRPLNLLPTFAGQLMLHLWRADPIPRRPVLRQFVALITNQAHVSSYPFRRKTWLLKRLAEHGYAEEAVAILRWLTRIRLTGVERPHLPIEDKDLTGGGVPLLALSIRIEISGDASELADYLEEHGAEIAKLCAPAMLRLGEQRILEAYEMLDLARGTDDSYDRLSYRRTSIAPSIQGRYSHAEDVFIVMVRQALDELRDSDPERLAEFAMARSGPENRALLRRLALYAFARHPTIEADALLDQATAQRWPCELPLGPELYFLLGAQYGHATENAKSRFIAALRDDPWWDGALDEHEARVRFSLSQLLHGLAPDSAVTTSFAETESASHPTWRQGDRDESRLAGQVGWLGEGPSPISADQMLAWPPEVAVSRLIVVLTDAGSRDEQSALLGAVQIAARTDPDWATGIFRVLAAVSSTDSSASAARLVEAISWGLREARPTIDQQMAFLGLCADSGWPASAANAVAFAVWHWTREFPQDTSSDLLDAYDRAADAIFQLSRTAVAGIGESDWFEHAKNHPAGHAALVWRRVAEARDRVDGQFVLSVDDAEKARWERVLGDASPAGMFARPILAAAVERLAAGDYPWAESVLFPAFDISEGERAAQLWDGLLMPRTWSWTVVAALNPYWPAFLATSAVVAPDRSSELGDVIAMIVVHRRESHWSLVRLHQFMEHATAEARRAFAGALPRHLPNVTADERRELWEEILLPYWRDRCTNVPLALDPEEVQEMISWVAALPEDSVQVAAQLEASSCDPMSDADSMLWEWREEKFEWVRDHPDAAVSIVKFLASHRSIQSWTAGAAVQALEVAINAGGDRSRCLQAAEEVADATNSQSAIEMVQRLRKFPQA